jgi:hypothetical protein
MKTFKGPNLSDGWKCPICGTDEDKEVVLIGVDGTQDGNLIESHQYHLSCIELIEHDMGEDLVLAMRISKRKSGWPE